MARDLHSVAGRRRRAYAGYCSGLIPAVLITFVQRSSSLLTNAVYGPEPCVGITKPVEFMRVLTSSDAMTLAIAASILSTIGLGVPLIAEMPDHDSAWKPL